MKDMTAVLKSESQKRGVKVGADVFDLLLSAACTECCSVEKGGNRSCPPKAASEELA
jgi:hypothetical protein